MRKIVIFALLLMMIASPALAVDWSRYESGRNNIRLDGYQGMPGYIAFADGSGNKTLYLYYNDTADAIFVVTPDALDLTTTKLSDSAGVALGLMGVLRLP